MEATQNTATRSPRDQTRWLAIRNTENRPVPGHGALRIIGTDYGPSDNGDSRIQQVFTVGRPDSDSEADQNPQMIIFNGPTPLTPYRSGYPDSGMGKGTQDWPALALADVYQLGSDPGVSKGEMFGPRENDYRLFLGGTAFTYVADNIATLAGTAANYKIDGASSVNRLRRIWVAPGADRYYGATFGLGGVGFGSGNEATVPSLNKIGWPSSSTYFNFLSQLNWGVPSHPDFQTIVSTTWNGGTGLGPQFPLAGNYRWAFHCSAYLPSPAPSPSTINITAYLDDTRLPQYVTRQQLTEIDNYGTEIGRPIENLAMGGVLQAAKYQTLNFRNQTGYSMTVSAAFITVERVPSRRLPATSGGGYGTN